MTKETKAKISEAAKASWTPERRQAQARRMRKLARKQAKARKAGGSVRRYRGKVDRSAPGSLGPQAEAILLLGAAAKRLKAGYRSGEDVGEADPYVFLALSALTKRGPP